MLEKIKEVLGMKNIPQNQYRQEKKKIKWDHIFLLEALLWSQKSHDPQTQCGCILVRDKTILSTGYNGFIRNISDKYLPNLRPHKYNFMIHAEHNAILNCVKNGISTNNSIAYITGEPCNMCLQYMWQAGIYEIVYSDFNDPKMMKNDEFIQQRNALHKLMNYGLIIDFIPSSKIDFSPIKNIYEKFCITQK